MSVLLFVCGIIMIELRMLGEYVGRSYITLNHVPQYIVRQDYHLDGNDQKTHPEERKCNLAGKGENT